MRLSIELESGDFRCCIKPELGGCIAGLWFGDIPVLRSTPASLLTSVRQAGSYPLVPYSNRLAHAKLKWAGTSHPLVQNNSGEPHAIHGVGWQRPWQVLDQESNFALLSYEHKADPSWPFAFDCSQAFRLTPQGLELSLSITNQSRTAAPAGLGWHPFFVKRAGSHIAFDATGRWEMGTDKLPTHLEAHHGLQHSCADLVVDHCFEGWRGVVALRDTALETQISSSLKHLVVYTDTNKDFVAIEPVSHVNNALTLFDQQLATAEALGLRTLQPGESMSADMSMTVNRA